MHFSKEIEDERMSLDNNQIFFIKPKSLKHILCILVLDIKTKLPVDCMKVMLKIASCNPQQNNRFALFCLYFCFCHLLGALCTIHINGKRL